MVLTDVAPHLKQEVPTFTPPSAQPAPFGPDCLQYFTLDPSWLHMNSGSYGVAPKCVQQAVTGWQDLSNRLPDLFHKRLYQEPLNRVRGMVAELVHTEQDNVVLINNSSTASNVVLRSVPWNKGDVVLSFSTAYVSCAATLKWLADRYGVRLEVIDVAYPVEDDELLDLVSQRIKKLKSEGLGIKLMLLDAISSIPGVRVPWERCVELLREEQILSLVDGAHALGQIPIDLDACKPDFFFSNLHKWLYGHRGSTFLYVDPKLQDMIQNMPTAMSYVPEGETFQPSDSYTTTSRFVTQFEWPTALHFGPLLSGAVGEQQQFSTTLAYTRASKSELTIKRRGLQAIEFRKWLGGEEAIRGYTTQLAKEGGQLVADILGTEVMQAAKSDLIASMVNVRLPLPQIDDLALLYKMSNELNRSLMEDHSTWAFPFLHNNQAWIRLSAQIFLGLEDFRKFGHILKSICERLDDMAAEAAA